MAKNQSTWFKNDPYLTINGKEHKYIECQIKLKFISNHFAIFKDDYPDVCKEEPPGKKCLKSKCKKKPCHGFYFDTKVEKCKKHKLCSAWRSQNKFETLKRCEKRCKPKLPDNRGM